jgi:cell division protease FtsH
VFGELTTGASDDLEKVTATAKQMVTRFGMSEKLGPRVFGHNHAQPFLGRQQSTAPDYSAAIAREIDGEIRRMVDAAHERAEEILHEHRDALTTIAEILLDRETLSREQFESLLAGEDDRDAVESVATPAQPAAEGAMGRRRGPHGGMTGSGNRGRAGRRGTQRPP